MMCAAPLLLAFLAARADAALYAAAGKADITPDLARETVWLAGYGASGRRARGVHDPLYARALVVSDGTRTAAFVSVDLLGLFREDVESMRARLGWKGPERLLWVSAAHQHSGPDTLGLWGRLPGVSGVDQRYRRRLHETVAGLVLDLSQRLREAELYAARAELDPRGLCRDRRDPVVLDPELNALQLRPRGGKGPALATVVRWSCHPEATRPDNRLVTADIPGALCDRVEAETGGPCLYLNGAIGGLLLPDTDRSADRQFAEAQRVGRAVADAALRALVRAERVPVARVRAERELVRLPIENSRYLLFLPNLTFGHRLYDRGGAELPGRRAWSLALRHLLRFPLPEERRPWVESEVVLARLGTVSLLGLPGEPFPELAIGGYDGRYRFGHPLTAPTNPDPPRLSQAPRAPFLRERLRTPHGLVVGLANDSLGYLVPEYDFKVAPTRSMLPVPPGHYDETNSLGPSSTRLILQACERLLSR